MSLLTDPAANAGTNAGASAGATASAGAAADPNAGAANGTAGAASGGTAAPSRWLVPEDMRGHEAARKFMDDKHTLDTSVLLKSHINLETKLGRDKVAIPKEGDDWNEVYDALGRPKTETDYKVVRPEKMPDGMKYDEEGEKHLRSWAYANGLNQKQFDAAYETLFKHNSDMQAGWAKVAADARGKCETDLKRQWGQAYDKEVAVAKTAYQEYADPDLAEFLNTTGLGDDPRLVRVFNKIGHELMGDDKLKGAGGNSGAMTVEQIGAKIDEFRKEHHAALFNSEHPQHGHFVKELEKLHRMKAGVVN